MPIRPAVFGRPSTRKSASDAARPNSTQRGYGYRWQQASKLYLNANPICVSCKARGLVVESTTVDHVIPHKGDAELFWDESNWMALCKPCHDRKTATKDGAFGREVKSE